MTVRCRDLALAAFAAAALLLGGQPLHAQGKATGTFLAEAFSRLTGDDGLLSRADGYGYREGISILGAWVNAGSRLTFDIPLTQGVPYLLLAAGDADAEDVDIEVLDKAGKVLASDVRLAAEGVLNYTPTATGQHTIRLTLYKARNNYPCVCVATILKKGGATVPLQNLEQAVNALIATLASVDQSLSKQSSRRLDLHRNPSQWALYGSVLAPNDSATVWNLQLGAGPKGFLAVGDKQAEDVDLFLLDNNRRPLKEDTGTGASASFVYEPGPGLYSLRVMNYRSQAPVVALMAVFDVR